MKTRFDQSEDDSYYMGSTDNYIPLWLRPPAYLSPCLQRSSLEQSLHSHDAAYPAADSTPSTSVKSLKATTGEAVQHCPARAAATTWFDESKRGERDAGEAEAAALHPVSLPAWPVTNVLQKLGRRCGQH